MNCLSWLFVFSTKCWEMYHIHVKEHLHFIAANQSCGLLHKCGLKETSQRGKKKITQTEVHTADYTLSGLGLQLGLVCVRAYCLDCNNASVQTYRYDIMTKGDSNWLRQVADDFILNSYFNDIIENPAVLNSLLKDKHKRAFL